MQDIDYHYRMDYLGTHTRRNEYPLIQKFAGVSLRWCLFLPMLALAACNPFLNHYSGESWPPVKSARVVMEPPNPNSVRWIGRSDFVSERKLGDPAATSAAKQVGANIVEWSDTDAGTKLDWTDVPFSINAWTGKVGMIPLPVLHEQYRYQARFYRSDSLGGEPKEGSKHHPTPKKVPPVDTKEEPKKESSN